MAPEQAQGLVHKIDARTDQFALAAITYAMLTGRHPFVGDDPVSLLYQVIHEAHPPLSRSVSWDTTAIQPVLDRALAKRQQDRFESVGEFARALRAAAGMPRDGRKEPAVEPAPRLRVLAGGRRKVEPPAIALPAVESPSEPADGFRRPRRVRTSAVFDDADLPRSIDRVPHGPQRAVALGLFVLGLAAFIGYRGWYHGFSARFVEAEHQLRSVAVEKWRAFKGHGSAPAPAPEATPLPIASRESAPVAASPR